MIWSLLSGIFKTFLVDCLVGLPGVLDGISEVLVWETFFGGLLDGMPLGPGGSQEPHS